MTGLGKVQKVQGGYTWESLHAIKILINISVDPTQKEGGGITSGEEGWNIGSRRGLRCEMSRSYRTREKFPEKKDLSIIDTR